MAKWVASLDFVQPSIHTLYPPLSRLFSHTESRGYAPRPTTFGGTMSSSPVCEGKFQQSFYLPEDLSRNIQYIKRSTRERLRGAQLRKRRQKTEAHRHISRAVTAAPSPTGQQPLAPRHPAASRSAAAAAAARRGAGRTRCGRLRGGWAGAGRRAHGSLGRAATARSAARRAAARAPREGSWKAPRRSVRPAGGGAGRPAAARGALQPLGGGLALPLDEVVDAALAIDLGAGQHA